MSHSASVNDMFELLLTLCPRLGLSDANGVARLQYKKNANLLKDMMANMELQCMKVDVGEFREICSNTIMSLAKCVPDFTRVCPTKGCASRLHVQSLFDVGKDGMCAAPGDCAIASMLKHWVYCAINWGTMPLAWICALDIVLFALGARPLVAENKERFVIMITLVCLVVLGAGHTKTESLL